MSIFDRTIKIAEENRLRDHNCIPFGFPKIDEYVYGVLPKCYDILTANSSVGKTKLVDALYWYGPYDFLLRHPDTNIKVKFFALKVGNEEKSIHFPLMASVLAKLKDERKKYMTSVWIAILSLVVSISAVVIAALAIN